MSDEANVELDNLLDIVTDRWLEQIALDDDVIEEEIEQYLEDHGVQKSPYSPYSAAYADLVALAWVRLARKLLARAEPILAVMRDENREREDAER